MFNNQDENQIVPRGSEGRPMDRLSQKHPNKEHPRELRFADSAKVGPQPCFPFLKIRNITPVW